MLRWLWCEWELWVLWTYFSFYGLQWDSQQSLYGYLTTCIGYTHLGLVLTTSKLQQMIKDATDWHFSWDIGSLYSFQVPVLYLLSYKWLGANCQRFLLFIALCYLQQIRVLRMTDIKSEHAGLWVWIRLSEKGPWLWNSACCISSHG